MWSRMRYRRPGHAGSGRVSWKPCHERCTGLTGVGGEGPTRLFTSMTNARSGRRTIPQRGWVRRFPSDGSHAASRGRPGGTTCYRAVSVLSRMYRSGSPPFDPRHVGRVTEKRSPSPSSGDAARHHPGSMEAGHREPGARFAYRRPAGTRYLCTRPRLQFLYRG